MPYQMMHLLIAKAFAADKPRLREDAAFYLGVITPDAIHMRTGTVGAVEKYGTHLKPTGSNGLREVTAYWMEQTRTPFHIGYGVHVITDRLWTRYYPTAFPALMRLDGSTNTEIYRPDAEWVDRALQRQSPDSDRLVGKLRCATPPASHPLLTTDEMDRWRMHVISEYTAYQTPSMDKPKVMTMDRIETFMTFAVSQLNDLIPGQV